MRSGVRWVVAGLLATIVLLDVGSMRHLSVTYDEPSHFRYGQQILGGNAARFDDSKMPFSALNALPGVVGRWLPDGPLATSLATLETGRYMTVLCALLLALCVFRWSTELYGPAAGILSLTLDVFDPNLLAHSQLVTTDVFAAGVTLASLYTFWRFLREGTVRWALASAGVVAVAQLAKYTAIFLFPLFAVVAVAFHAGEIAREWTARDVASLRQRAVRVITYAALSVTLSVAVINVGFLFDRTLTPLSAYSFRSDLFRSFQQTLGPAGALPVPMPYPYLEGLDWIVQRERTGEGYGSIYLFGELRHAEGFAGYYLYASLFKVPLAMLLVWLVALGTWLARRGRADLRRHEWVLIWPILFFTVYFNWFYRAQIGLRFFVVIFPLLHVLSGRLLAGWPSVTRPVRMAMGVAGVYLVASVLSYYPHFLPYFNELVPNRRLAYRILADSNLDWRQHLWYQEQFLSAHPDAIIEPDGPTAGTIIVGANSLTGVAGEPEKFRWLREHFEPVDDIAYSTLVFRVTRADLDRLGLRGAAPRSP